jgi:hypothetical protein
VHNRNEYIFRGPTYDNEIMRKAAINLQSSWLLIYDVRFRNCQHFDDALRAEYFRLGGIAYPAPNKQ